MATKRMFSKDIVGSDAFQDMPASSQLLYFHLGMEADDDGFIGNPKKIARSIGMAEDDMKILLSKRFVLPFDSGVLVIKHHRINNNWDKYNCKRTMYLEEFNQLYIKPNKAYTKDKTQGISLQSENSLKTVYRIEENRIDKKRREEGLAKASFLLREDINTGEDYQPDHNPPKKKKFIPTENQVKAYGNMKPLDYFHAEGVKRGYEYLKEEDEQANKKFVGLGRALVKRYPNNWKEVIDWWFESNDNAWCDYHPSNFFSISTWMKFDNKHKVREEVEI